MTKERWARVLIVEDSPTSARILVNGISRDQRLAVAGVASTVAEATTLAEQLLPDVITLDLMLPDGTGLDIILRVLRRRYVPIIVVSSLPNDGSSSQPFRALLAGAADIVHKPEGDGASRWAFFDDLNERIASLASAAAVPTYRPSPLRQPSSQNNGRVEIGCVVVGASTGGPTALVEFLSGLGADFPAPIVIVQHIAAPFVEGLVKWLNQETSLSVNLAADGDLLLPSRVYIAPAGADLLIKSGGRLSVKAAAPGRTQIAPSADALFDSAADVYKARCAAVLLSGMGKDGAAGLLKVRNKGGKTFAQDEPSCTVFGMPEAAGRMGAVETFEEPRSIAAHLQGLVERPERIVAT